MIIFACIILLILFLILPTYLIKISRRFSLDKFLSDIIFCYLVGILAANTKWLWLHGWGLDASKAIDSATQSFTTELASASVMFAIPMLLMLNNVKDWLKHTRRNTLIFLSFSFSVMCICFSVGYWYKNSLPHSEIATGMMTGVYIGGTPNMVAISKALEADKALFGLLNATDTFCSAFYIFFMFSFAKPLLGRFLPKFKSTLPGTEIIEELKDEYEYPFPPKAWKWPVLRPLLIGIGISVCAIAVSLVPAILFPNSDGKMNTTLLVLVLTSIGIGLSFFEQIRKLTAVYSFAHYLLLVFGICAGYMADFGHMINEGGQYLVFNIIIITLILILHFLLALILRVDIDSFIICSVANVMGPPFMAQAASSIKNRELIPVGITLALLGLAIANYCGIFVYTLLRSL